MNNQVFIFHVIFAVFLSTFSLNAQDKVVNGMVTTFDSIPLIGASVQVKSTNIIAHTDSLGNFSVLCNSKDKIAVSANGFYTQKIRLNSNIKFAAVNLKMKSTKKSSEHMIGYGYVSDNDKTSAVESLNSHDTNFSRYLDIYDLIKGQFAGVQVVGTEIHIRGENSINSSNAALIVIDGIIMDNSTLNTLHPLEVKNIHVIKDGSAAVYGSRGSNGVVLIETKKGGDK